MAPLDVALTWATPSVPMIADVPERFAEAPVGPEVTLKVTTPPATGSTGLLAVTVTARGKVASIAALCAVLPPSGSMVNPWLWKAPMSTDAPIGSPRWSVVIPWIDVPAPMAGLPGKRAMVRVGPP